MAMPTIWKFPLVVSDVTGAPMPRGAKVLCVQAQHDVPCIWALVDPDAPVEPREFRIIGTGHPITDELGPYVGTFQLMGGGLVFHVFEPLPPPQRIGGSAMSETQTIALIANGKRIKIGDRVWFRLPAGAVTHRRVTKITEEMGQLWCQTEIQAGTYYTVWASRLFATEAEAREAAEIRHE